MDEIDRIERRLKLHDVRVLMSVVEAGSMHKAGNALQPRSPLFRERLLTSSTHSAFASSIAVRAALRRLFTLARCWRAAFDELRQGVKDIETLADPTAGELRIGCPESIAVGPVFAVVDRLTRRHPRMVFDVVTCPIAAAYRELTERKVELVMGRITELVAEEHVVAESLFDYATTVVAAPENPWSRQRRIGLAELVNEPWTLPPPDTYIGALAAQAFRAQGLKLPRSMVTTLSLDMRKRLVATGRFLTMLPSYTLPLSGKPLSLKALPVALPETHGMIAIITLKNRTLSPLGDLFMKTARAVAKSLAKAK